MSAESPSGTPPMWSTPEFPRVLPFAVFLVIGSLAGKWFPGSEYWLYALKTVVVAAVVWVLRSRIAEMRWNFSLPALGVGVAVAALWIALDGIIPSLASIYDRVSALWTGQAAVPRPVDPPWNPLAFFSGAPALGWAFVGVRVLGRSLLVPMIEEVFYRSFVYRMVMRPDFLQASLREWNLRAFAVTCLLFGLSHPDQWLAALLCAALYQGLVLRSGRIGDAMLAHGVTNGLISAYAIATGRWQFT
ncbi:MAG: CAAX prenyl protease-related protein [Verrucomicrobiota bacterium]